MRRAPSLLLAVFAVAAWAACDTDAPTTVSEVQPLFDISDGAHAGAYQHFFWLPPLVAPSAASGTFDGTLSPRVEICELSGGACDDPWVFTRTSGPASHRVGVDAVGQHYHLNWDTKAFELGDQYPYRISVWLGEVQLGYIDVQFGATGQEAKNLATDEVVPLNDGRILPIKFRIEEEVREELSYEIAFYALTGADPANPFLTDVYLLDRQSLVRKNLTHSPGTLDGMPSWSPDGERLVFASDRNAPGRLDLFVMDADGSNVQPLVENGWNPVWSPFPDYNWVAFQRVTTEDGLWDPEDIHQNIWIVNVDTGEEIQVTDVACDPANDPFEDLSPAWRNWRGPGDPPPPPILSFARTENFTEHPGDYDIGPLGIPVCANPTRDLLTGQWFFVESFDVVQWGGPPVLRNVTADAGTDELGPAWSHAGQKVVFQRREGDAPYGPDDGNLFIQFTTFGPEPSRVKVQLTFEEGWTIGVSDWAPDDSEILVGMGPSFEEVGLWVMVPPASPSDPVNPPTLLASHAMGGKYRPGT